MRDKLAEHALAHLNDIEVRLREETAESIAKSKIISATAQAGELMVKLEENRKRINKIEHTYEMRLVDVDSVSCLVNMPMLGKVAVMNYASYKYPGGYFIGGSSAQEEMLCHESNLYPVLCAFPEYYNWNKQNLNRALYEHRAIYSPDIVFERGDKMRKADVITCAAPNWGTAVKCRVSLEENLSVMESRIHFVAQAIQQYDVQTLITGAWGCGVFKQDATQVARMMCQAFGKNTYGIKRVYFAIPNRHSWNYKKFAEVLAEYETDNIGEN